MLIKCKREVWCYLGLSVPGKTFWREGIGKEPHTEKSWGRGLLSGATKDPEAEISLTCLIN